MRSVSLLQRRLEELGIATVSICNQPEVSEKVCVPRAVFIQYPYGRMLGDVGDREGQRAVCDDMCAHLEAADGPNAYRHLSHEWPRTARGDAVETPHACAHARFEKQRYGAQGAWGTIRMRDGPIWTRTTARGFSIHSPLEGRTRLRKEGSPSEEGGFAV